MPPGKANKPTPSPHPFQPVGGLRGSLRGSPCLAALGRRASGGARKEVLGKAGSWIVQARCCPAPRGAEHLMWVPRALPPHLTFRAPFSPPLPRTRLVV